MLSTQDETRRDELIGELEDFDVDQPGATARMAAISSELATLDARDQADQADRARALIEGVRSGRLSIEGPGLGAHAGDQDRRPHRPALPAVGAAMAPLPFNETQLRQLHAACEARTSFQISAPSTRDLGFNTAEGDLPAQLSPTVIGPQYEDRLLSRLPVLAIGSPSLEYVRHTGTTGTPAIVAEGDEKPELLLTVDHITATVSKIAAHAAVSWEIASDWPTFVSYVQGELSRQLVDVENDLLLNGTAPSTIVGLIATPNVLTHSVTSETSLDAIEMAIAELRVGSSLATANLLVLHPSTWSAIRRSKDDVLRYLTTSDPTVGEADTVWGVPVLVTTQIDEDLGVLLDTRKFGRILVREAITLRTGFDAGDFTHNRIRFVAEERLALAVERPTAVLVIDGLAADGS